MTIKDFPIEVLARLRSMKNSVLLNTLLNCPKPVLTSKMEANFKVVIKRIASNNAKDTNGHPPVQDKISIIDCAQEMERQEEEKIEGKKEGSKIPNILIFAKNTVTLDDYITKTYFDENFISQLEKWIKKRKFTISPWPDTESRLVEINLSVEFFSFTLRKIKRSEEKSFKKSLHC